MEEKEKKVKFEEVESDTITLNQESNQDISQVNQENYQEALMLMRLASDQKKINKAYRNYIYGIGERRVVSKKEKQKKKSKKKNGEEIQTLIKKIIIIFSEFF